MAKDSVRVILTGDNVVFSTHPRPTACYEEVAPTFRQADIRFGNLEWPITKDLALDPAKDAAFKNQTTKAAGARSEVISAWVNAKGPDKVKAQRAVQEFNRTAKPDQKIATKDLTNAGKRREREGSGIMTNKRTAPTRDRLDQIYQ